MKRLLPILLTLLFALSACRPAVGPPPTPTPVFVDVPEPPEPSRGIGTGTGCALGLEGGPGTGDHQFPRIIATDGDYNVADSNASNLAAVARYDGVLWTLDWPTYQNYSTPPSVTTPFAYVRNLNAKTKFIAVNHSYSITPSYCHIPTTYPHRCAIVTAQTTADGRTAAGDGWLAKDRVGGYLDFTDSKHMNWSALDPDGDPSGILSWAEWFGNYIVDEVNDDQCSGSDCWDGYYFESMNTPHGLTNFVRIDANENGTTDIVEGAWTKCVVDAHQMDSYNAFFDALDAGGITVAGGEGNIDAGLAGANSAPHMIGHATAGYNGDFPRAKWADCSSGPNDYSGGFTTPGGNLWHYNMRQAILWENTGSLVVNLAGEELYGAGGDSYYTNYVSDWNQQRRLVVGSTLLINGYSVPHRDQVPKLYPCDECLVNASGNSTTAIADGGWLGCPLGPARNTTNNKNMREVLADAELLSGRIWWRAYTNGLVIVNASETDNVAVDFGDTGDWRKILASGANGGDTTHNDGGAVTDGIITVDAYDAYVLVRVDADTGTAVPAATATTAPTACPGCTPTAIPTTVVSGSATPEPLTCPGLPSSGSAILKNRSGVVVETVVFTDGNEKSFGAVNWMTPPPNRTWATGTPNPGTAATAVP